jgi:cellulose synthase/poly-beta-1,6-N-acetylglucosamine synthase-like glycosyltransferase
VSIVIAARNEGARICERIDNLLQLDYPASRRQIIVVSDGSTDDTLARLTRFGSSIDVVPVEAGGKARALNAGVRHARHDILVFTDTRQVFAPDALIELTAPFEDPRVGGVTGELLLDCECTERRVASRRACDRDRATARAGSAAGSPVHTSAASRGDSRTGSSAGSFGPHAGVRDRRIVPDRRLAVRSTIADGLGLYWQYEKRIRRSESAVGSTLGATGAIYALRRSLWQPLPPDTILDDVLAPMRAVVAGYRVVFNERARAFDRASLDAGTEAHRKVRTLAGNYQILWLDPRLLLPWCNPVWWQYLSHKIGRLIVPYALLSLVATSIALADRSVVYRTALVVQCAFYLLAGYGAWLDLQGTTAARREAQAKPEWTRHPDHHEGIVNG